MNLHMIYKLFILCILIFSGCNTGVVNNGSGTLTTNGVCVISAGGTLSGYVFACDSLDRDAEIKVHNPPVSIQIFDNRYQPYDRYGFTKILIPDSNGNFRCDSLVSGLYNVFGYDTVVSKCFFLKEIPVVTTNSAVTIRKDFSAWSTINGTVRDISELKGTSRGVYIIGSPFFDITDNSGAFLLQQIPPGNYTIKADYFQSSNSDVSMYLRIKGSKPNKISTVDSLIVYTDSATVEINSGETEMNIDFSL